MHDESFVALIDSLRRGDGSAAAEFVRRYEPEIRRVVRVRLVNPQLQRQFDSMDICQSVMANFFVRFGSGQFDIETPEQLLKLLVTMARNKLTDNARKQHSAKRDNRREGADDGALQGYADNVNTPSVEMMNREMLSHVRARLDTHEMELFEDRANGCQWDELAEKHKVSAEALRKRYSRAIDRVVGDMGFAGADGDD
jgi:RNA polymerase sigma-70 factor (ECF subfamily)